MDHESAMRSAERFIKKIETEAHAGLSDLDAAEKRGELTIEDRQRLADIEFSRIPNAYYACKIAAQYAGKSLRCRDSMIPNVLEQKGLHVSNRAERPEIYIYGPIGESHGGVSARTFAPHFAGIRPAKRLTCTFIHRADHFTMVLQ